MAKILFLISVCIGLYCVSYSRTPFFYMQGNWTYVDSNGKQQFTFEDTTFKSEYIYGPRNINHRINYSRKKFVKSGYWKLTNDTLLLFYKNNEIDTSVTVSKIIIDSTTFNYIYVKPSFLFKREQ